MSTADSGRTSRMRQRRNVRQACLWVVWVASNFEFYIKSLYIHLPHPGFWGFGVLGFVWDLFDRVDA